MLPSVLADYIQSEIERLEGIIEQETARLTAANATKKRKAETIDDEPQPEYQTDLPF